jgi:hypothetical protein
VQPWWLDATGSALRLTDAYAGGEDDEGDYAAFRGGLKRFRVAKKKAGKWTNTWMAADEAAWVDSSDLDAIRGRPEAFAGLLGEVAPEDKIEALLGIIERKREHLRDFPASCAARTAREDAFDLLYTTADEFFGLTRAEVDAQWRLDEDYIFAELVYAQSKTCCWNSTNRAMYEAIVEVVAARQAQAQVCEPPLVFKAVDGGYDEFAAHDPAGWVAWSADEACPQAGVRDDVEATSQATEYCEWAAPTPAGSCAGHCGGPADACWCDAACAGYGDCCDDFDAACA